MAGWLVVKQCIESWNRLFYCSLCSVRSVHYLCEGVGKNEGAASNFCVAQKGGYVTFCSTKGGE